jgi:hypothetical protein
MMKIIVLVAFLLSICSAQLQRDQDNDSQLRNAYLASRYNGMYRNLDELAIKYGDLSSPLCYSNGPAKTLNMTNIGLATLETIDVFMSESTPDMVYMEQAEFGVGRAAGFPTDLIVVGGNLTLTGILYTQVMVKVKMYHMTNMNMDLDVEQVGADTFRVGGRVLAMGQSANPICVMTPGCYPGTWAETTPWMILQHRYHEYVRSYDGPTVVYRLKKMLTVHRTTHRFSTLYTSTTSVPLLPFL